MRDRGRPRPARRAVGRRPARARTSRAPRSSWSGTVDAGHGCPISMTYAVVPALRANPELAAQFEPLLTNREYDSGLRDPDDQARPDRRHVDDREAGRLRRPRQHHDRDRPQAGRHLPADRAQVVHLGADVRRVPDARPGAGGAVLLPGAAGAARRRAQRRCGCMRLKDKLGNQSNASSEIEYDGARRLAGRRGGPRRPDHRRDGQHDPARLRHRHRRPACAPALVQAAHHAAPPQRVRQAADRPAADAQRARRPRGRVRGGDDRDDAAGRRQRPGGPRRRGRGRRCAGSALAVDQVLRLQARPVARRRGAGVPGRQRLRRGLRHAAALPRAAAALDLGGLRQRRRARRAARDRPRAAHRSRRSSTSSSWPPAPTPGSTTRWPRLQEGVHVLRRHRAAGPPDRRADGPGPPGLAAAPARTGRGRRRVLRVAGSTATGAARSAPCRPASTSAPIIERAAGRGLRDGDPTSSAAGRSRSSPSTGPTCATRSTPSTPQALYDAFLRVRRRRRCAAVARAARAPAARSAPAPTSRRSAQGR